MELRLDRPSYMVLRGNYGQRIHRAFRLSRQGVRWRFQRLFNDIYVSSFETILFIEKIFGAELREYALRISKERYDLHQQMQADFASANQLPSQPDREAPAK
ncbi:MAG: hypothetical protein ACOC93_00070 [Planctomycetota bacterium]